MVFILLLFYSFWLYYVICALILLKLAEPDPSLSMLTAF